MIKWVWLTITVAVGVWFTILAWLEIQKPLGDNPPVHFLCVMIFLGAGTILAWVTPWRRR